jgi:hypothetical protein
MTSDQREIPMPFMDVFERRGYMKGLLFAVEDCLRVRFRAEGLKVRACEGIDHGERITGSERAQTYAQ